MPERLVTNHNPHTQQAPPAGELERAARTALELRKGRALADAEWAASHARLVEFAVLLRSWGRKTEIRAPRLDEAA